MILRLLAGALMLLSILFMPLWLSIILAFAGMVYFSVYIEAVIFFLLSDLVFGPLEAELSGAMFISFSIFSISLVVIEFFKKKVRFYA